MRISTAISLAIALSVVAASSSNAAAAEDKERNTPSSDSSSSPSLSISPEDEANAEARRAGGVPVGEAKTDTRPTKKKGMEGLRRSKSASVPLSAKDKEAMMKAGGGGSEGGGRSKSKSLASEPGAVGIRGDEDLELNCPSISYKFPLHSTLRCESCKALGRILHYAVASYRRPVEDMLISGPSQRGPELCVIASVVSELRQKTNGMRFWDLTRLMKEGDLIEHSPYVDHDYDPLPAADRPEVRKREIQKARAAGYGEFAVENDREFPLVADNDKAMSINNRRVTYHTKYERETLPCANYFFNRYCLAEYLGEDDTYDAVEGCVNAFVASTKAHDAQMKRRAQARLKQLVAEGEASPPSVFEIEEMERKKSKHADEQRSTALLNCLTGKVCGSLGRKECDTRQLFEMQKGERDDFLKFEAKYGNTKNPFVGSALNARKLERNPYATNAPPSKDESAGEL